MHARTQLQHCLGMYLRNPTLGYAKHFPNFAQCEVFLVVQHQHSSLAIGKLFYFLAHHFAQFFCFDNRMTGWYAVGYWTMIICNGVVGLCVLIGGLRHREQVFRVEGASVSLATLMALSALTLVLPG